MYWREKFPTHQHALQAARAFRRGRPLTLSQHAAASQALGELTETPELGSLKSFLKKAVKTASKLSPSHQAAKALKITKFSPSHALAERIASSAPKSAPQGSQPVAPAEPLMVPPTIAMPTDFSAPIPFAQSGGGGGGGFMPLPAAPETQAASGPNWWLIGGAGALGLVLLYLVLKKR